MYRVGKGRRAKKGSSSTASLEALLRPQIGATPLKFEPNQLVDGEAEQHAHIACE